MRRRPSLLRRVSTQSEAYQERASRYIYRILLYKSPQSVVQVVLSTAHPTKFSEAVTKALSTSQGFDFEQDVLPQEFRGLLEKERRVVDVDEPNKELGQEGDRKQGWVGR
jgi:threonine synthase